MTSFSYIDNDADAYMMLLSQPWGMYLEGPEGYPLVDVVDSNFPNVRQDYMGDPGVPGSSEPSNQHTSSSLLGVTSSNNKRSAQESITGTSSQTDVADMPPQTRAEKGKYPSDWLQSESRRGRPPINGDPNAPKTAKYVMVYDKLSGLIPRTRTRRKKRAKKVRKEKNSADG